MVGAMAIEKNGFKVSQFDSACSPGSRDSMSTDEDEIQYRASAVESDEDDEFDDVDSGAGSDDFDLLELGETGAEFCQVGNQTCSIPFELYDLSSLEDVLSVDVWNECLTEEERLGLAKFLPDMDQETYMITLMELFKGCNFNFGSPLNKLFEMLKGGLCEPRVALYREGLNSFEKRQHYHLLKKHQNQMVTNLCQIRDAWHTCRGYGIEEKLRVLNIVKSQKSLMWEKNIESDSSGREDLGERLWSRRDKERNLGHPVGPTSVYNNVDLDWESPMALDSIKSSRLNSKGTVKIGSSKTPSGRQLVSGLPSLYQGTDLKPSSYNSLAAIPRQSKAAGLDTDAMLKLWDRMRGYDEVEDPVYGVGSRRDQIISRGGLLNKPSYLKAGKNHNFLGNDESYPDSFVGLPLSSKGNLHVYGSGGTNQLFDRKMLTAKPPSVRTSGVYSKKAGFPENSKNFRAEGASRSSKSRLQQLQTKRNQGDMSELGESFVHERTEEEVLPMDGQFEYDNWTRSKKWKKEREASDANHPSLTLQMDEGILTSDMKGNFSSEKSRVGSKKNGRLTMGATGSRMFTNGDVTESDTSSSFDDEDSNPLIRSKSTYPSGFMERPHSFSKPQVDLKNGKIAKKDKKENVNSFDGPSQIFSKMDDLGDQLYLVEDEKYPSTKGKKKNKGKMHENPSLQTSAGGMDSTSLYDLGDEDRSQSYEMLKNGLFQGGATENLQISPPKASRKGSKLQGEVNPVYIQDGDVDSINGILQADDKKMKKQGKKGKNNEKVKGDFPDASVPNRKAAAKKRKKDEVVSMVVDENVDIKLEGDIQLHVDDPSSSRKRTKKNLKVEARAPDGEASNLPIIDSGVTADMELEKKPLKKAFTPITPTVHTGFSFSIIHLLSAVRLAMITHLPDDSFGIGKALEESNRKHDDGIDGDSPENAAEGNVPSLTIQEIVDRVRSNPGDPCILETQEPLQDLVRGVLKILSSRTAPLGAKGWKSLVVYQKSRKGWSWIGPVLGCASDQDIIEEVTSPEAWAIPHKMLVKLVDSFANWLKSSQETLQQIGSLPPPPLALMQFNLEEKERFRDLKAQKSLSTIIRSPDEVRAYFQKEEVLRYSIPDRAFSYTAADGNKSVVAPLRRSSGKPTSKARDHFMLKRDRPPNVTILCLVRDAASRLPGSIGTRADVCTLIRDSQYIVEDVSDAQVNQVVSGALDRLHYERDPCVQFDPERKLWKYLHREKEEEDFEDDGTSSTKKWKRPKKEAVDQFDEGGVTVAYQGAEEEPSAFDLCSDLNFEPASLEDDKVVDPTLDDCRLNEGDMNIVREQNGGIQQEQPVVWSSFELNPLHENKMFCQENSTNEDFDDETLGRDRSAGIISTGLF